MSRGATALANGYVSSSMPMTFRGGYLHLVTVHYQQQDRVSVETFRVDPSTTAVEPSGDTLVESATGGALGNPAAARLDGDRLYLTPDDGPIAVVDVADPTSPRPLGQIETGDWLEAFEPRGDHLIAIGFDRAGAAPPVAPCSGVSHAPATRRQLGIALLDVRDPSAVCLAAYARTSSSEDESAKRHRDLRLTVGRMAPPDPGHRRLAHERAQTKQDRHAFGPAKTAIDVTLDVMGVSRGVEGPGHRFSH